MLGLKKSEKQDGGVFFRIDRNGIRNGATGLQLNAGQFDSKSQRSRKSFLQRKNMKTGGFSGGREKKSSSDSGPKEAMEVGGV